MFPAKSHPVISSRLTGQTPPVRRLCPFSRYECHQRENATRQGVSEDGPDSLSDDQEHAELPANQATHLLDSTTLSIAHGESGTALEASCKNDNQADGYGPAN